MYNHTKQLRCDFIRGKSQREMDDMLPLYAKAVAALCPCPVSIFPDKFDEIIKGHLTLASKKTLANHRTEIAGALLGLYYEENEEIFESDRNKKFLQDSDQPSLFKDICFKHQFPTGVQNISTAKEKLDDGIKFRPYPFILKALKLSEEGCFELTINDIGYYILNSEDVLKGNATPGEVFSVIAADKTACIERHIPNPEGKAQSYVYQHIREQLNYLELANLIFIDTGKTVRLNHYENKAIDIFLGEYGKSLPFDFNLYDLNSKHGRCECHLAWRKYYGELSIPTATGNFITTASAILSPASTATATQKEDDDQSEDNAVEIGDEGEGIVFKYEKARVQSFCARMANRVLLLGKTRGLGYDIQSVVAETGPRAEFYKYIEVKTTKRVTAPSVDDDTWSDNITITRNEFLAAEQHGEVYCIFRVYITRSGVTFHIIGNVRQKLDEGRIDIVPLTYRVDFSGKSIDYVISPEQIQERINA